MDCDASTILNQVANDFIKIEEEKHEQLAAALTEHQQEMIESFGGITNMIHLCLTNPQATRYVDTDCQQFQTLKKIINDTNKQQKKDETDSDSNSNLNCNYSYTYTYNYNNNNNNNCNNNDSQIDTISQFNDSKIILNIDPKDNLCFKLMKNENLALKLYNLSLNKIYLFVVCFCIVVSLIVHYLSLVSIVSRSIYIVIATIVSLFVIIYCISVGLTFNTMIIELITNTFDFWFKIYNTLLLYVAAYIRYYNATNTDNTDNNHAAEEAVIDISVTCATILLFLLDAIPIKTNFKRIAIVVFIITMSYGAIVIYFSGIDYKWNPFKSFKYTQISFKSIMLTSYLNIILFVGKPVFTDAMRYLRKKTKTVQCNPLCCNCETETTQNKNIGNHDHGSNSVSNQSQSQSQLQRCATIYKRPFVKWNLNQLIASYATSRIRSRIASVSNTK